MKRIAFIPARQGSERVLNKNVKLLNNHPLLSYTVKAAIHSDLFDQVVIITDSQYYADVAVDYGAFCPGMRPGYTATPTSPDFDWLEWVCEAMSIAESCDLFSILRPTSPLRSPADIKSAFDLFEKNSAWCDSVRAMKKVQEHPGKMWSLSGNFACPIMPFQTMDKTPWHSSQMKSLPQIYVQSAAIEISKFLNVKKKSISGDFVCPFIHEGPSTLDINSNDDWVLAEHYAKSFDFYWM